MADFTRRQALACSALSLPLLAARTPKTAGDLRADVDQIVKSALASWSVPGVAVGIVRDGKVIYLAGHGVKKLGEKAEVTPDSLFSIASCTKAFTTTAMAKLVGTGRMGWDDPVRNYLEYFRLADPSADRLVTLRDLLCHRTGIASHDLLWYRAAWGPRNAVRRIGRLAPELPFRSSFQYQSTMVAAAGYAVEAVLGKDKTWEGFVRETILKPLGMTRTSCTTTETAKETDRATPHRRDRKGVIQPIDWYEMKEPDPAGSIVSCARDLCQWALFHLREGRVLRDGQEVELVNRQALAETHAPQNVIPFHAMDRERQPETDQMTYCMGWVRQDYRGKVLLSHAGIIDGFLTQITLVPREKEQLGIVLLNNLHGTDMNLALSNTLVDYLLDLPRSDWNADLGKVAKQRDDAAEKASKDREKKRHPDAKHSRDLPAYAGTYREAAYGDAEVKCKDGELTFEWSTFKCPLKHFHFDTFVAQSEILDDPFVNFSLGLDGSVVTLNVLGRYFVRIK